MYLYGGLLPSFVLGRFQLKGFLCDGFRSLVRILSGVLNAGRFSANDHSHRWPLSDQPAREKHLASLGRGKAGQMKGYTI